MSSEIPIIFTRMGPEELERISELDRSEHVTLAYELEDGELTQVDVDWQVPTWSTDNEGEHSLAAQLAFCRSHLEKGGVMFGAYRGDRLVGVAIVRPRLRDAMAQLAFLHVSRNFRRLGIARQLMEEACDIARSAGARRIYVSAVPTSSSVGFYLAQGCHLAEEVDPELYALEPDDIHMILDL
jgi:predicted N-acetyltransferase YhbS